MLKLIFPYLCSRLKMSLGTLSLSKGFTTKLSRKVLVNFISMKSPRICASVSLSANHDKGFYVQILSRDLDSFKENDKFLS